MTRRVYLSIYFIRRSRKRAVGSDDSENESPAAGKDSDVDMEDEEQPKTRRFGKQRASDGSEEGVKQKLSRAERLSARTLAKVCIPFFFLLR